MNAEAPVLEAARSQIAATMLANRSAALPMNGRNFLDVALLVPGVAPANVASTQLFPETSAVPGVTLSVGSQRNLSNNFIVDGLSANDDAAGLSGITYGVDAIEQFQVVTSGGQAELGRALGGYINIVTRAAPTAARHRLRLRARRCLNAENPLSGPTLPMRQAQFGAQPGRADRADRTFFFANGEQRDLDQTGLTTIPDAERRRDQRAPRRRRLPRPGRRHRHLSESRGLHERLREGRSPGPATATSSACATACMTSTAPNSRGAGGLSAPTASPASTTVDQTVALSNTLVLSARTVLETRAQFAHSDLLAPPIRSDRARGRIAGVATFGTSSSSPTGRLNTLYQVVNNVSHQCGAHALRAGVDVLYNDDLITFPRSVRGSYTFSSLANFLTGTYNNAGFTQTFGVTEVAQTNPNLGVYVQDEWKATPDVTLNAGLRYDLQWLETIETTPTTCRRASGVAWAPFDVAPHGGARQRRPVLRSRAAARARQRAAVGGQHDGRESLRQTSSACRRRRPARRCFPTSSRRRAAGDAREPDHHGPRAAERLVTPGERGDRAADRRTQHGELSATSTCEGSTC